MRFDSWIGLFSALWLAFFVLGRWQFQRARRGTARLVQAEGRQTCRLPRPPSVEELYQGLQPAWEAVLRQRAWFIPHRTELFPVPVRPGWIRKRLNFTPGWVGAYLRLNGIQLPAEPALEAEIARILALAPRPR